MIKILLGGSPCTFWSIAQKNNRETKAEGMGWELFKNYLIAKEKFKPDFFLYENNKSAAQAIKDQIAKELGTDLMYINSALVSAQNRQRFYVFNWEVEQPEDRGILLRDILESGTTYQHKAWCLTANYSGACKADFFKSVRSQVFEKSENPTDVYVNGNFLHIEHNSSRSDKKVLDMTAAMKVKEATKKGYAEILLGECVDLTQPNSKTRSGRRMGAKSNCLMTGNQYYQYCGMANGYYIVRKFTPTECERLQTMPVGYTEGISTTQRYKALGNGWTAEVIIHILQGALKDVPKDEEIVVLSMYDGIGTGRYCLDKMGFTNVKYFAYEIDKYAKEIAMKNYPDIIQMGDAFQLRHPDWTIGY